MKLREHLSNIDTRLALIEQNLREHMRRTELLELRISPLTKIYHFLQVTGALLVIFAAVSGIIRLFI